MRAMELSKSKVPPSHDWRTSDADEIARRRLRAQTEPGRITNLDPSQRIFSNFRVTSTSGMNYTVEIRSLAERRFSCTCVDFRINGLGTCKHVEATLLYLEARYPRLFRRAHEDGSRRIDIVPDSVSGALRVERLPNGMPGRLKRLFTADGTFGDGDPEEALEQLRNGAVPGLRISQDVASWLEARRQAEERKTLRREYEQRVQSGEWPAQETRVPLYPYQREGMLHLAFTERALLADEMGLGKTLQAIAACSLLHRLGNAERVLVVTPADRKTEWEEQIQRFTDLPLQLVFGSRHERLKAYNAPLIPSSADGGRVAAGPGEGQALNPHPSTFNFPFFTIVNYEQMLADGLEVNDRLQPDIV